MTILSVFLLSVSAGWIGFAARWQSSGPGSRHKSDSRRGGFTLVIHSVRTHDEIHGALRRLNWNGPALVHGFSGSFQQAEKLVALGCSIGVGGVITHPRARKTRDAVARLPLEALVLETDAPDMSPQVMPGAIRRPISGRS